MRRQWALAIVVAFVGGSLMTGTMASAEPDTFNFDSFFDVFYEIDLKNTCPPGQIPKVNPDLLTSSCSTVFAVDSFFDVFYEIDTRVSNLEDTQTQASTTSAFVKFDGIDGESVESSHIGWSDLLSFNQGQSVPEPSGESRRRAAVSLEDLVVVKEVDKASPKIAEAVLDGKVFPKVEIHLTASFGDDPARFVYYTYELEDVRITSYNISGSGQGDDRPTENFSLNFEKIKVTYTELASDGSPKDSVEYTWNVAAGTP